MNSFVIQSEVNGLSARRESANSTRASLTANSTVILFTEIVGNFGSPMPSDFVQPTFSGYAAKTNPTWGQPKLSGDVELPDYVIDCNLSWVANGSANSPDCIGVAIISNGNTVAFAEFDPIDVNSPDEDVTCVYELKF